MRLTFDTTRKVFNVKRAMTVFNSSNGCLVDRSGKKICGLNGFNSLTLLSQFCLAFDAVAIAWSDGKVTSIVKELKTI